MQKAIPPFLTPQLSPPLRICQGMKSVHASWFVGLSLKIHQNNVELIKRLMGFQNYFENKFLLEYVFFELFLIEQKKKKILKTNYFGEWI